MTRTHTAPGKTTQTEVYTYIYDHAQRLTKVTHKLNTHAAVTPADYTYDELGRTLTRKNHGLASTEIMHLYNIRGWVVAIKRTLFTRDLYYHSSPGTATYNGNISAITRKAGTETITK